MSDRYINPVTEDFGDIAEGGYIEDDPVLNKLAFSFKVAKGSWEGDPEIGHRFDELARATDTIDNRRLLRIFAIEAAQWIVDDGDLDTIDVTVESHGAGLIAFQVVGMKAGRQVKAGPFIRPFGAG